jgi:hypothetical protein
MEAAVEDVQLKSFMLPDVAETVQPLGGVTVLMVVLKDSLRMVVCASADTAAIISSESRIVLFIQNCLAK